MRKLQGQCDELLYSDNCLVVKPSITFRINCCLHHLPLFTLLKFCTSSLKKDVIKMLQNVTKCYKMALLKKLKCCKTLFDDKWVYISKLMNCFFINQLDVGAKKFMKLVVSRHKVRRVTTHFSNTIEWRYLQCDLENLVIHAYGL